ncbi:MAG: LacI family transcriptional regulator [Anaerocolumna sp.]|jgi:ribose transport system substrate-binding protein|nr:LacI family transcriptional regulator [Anaerocolumna sp.]
MKKKILALAVCVMMIGSILSGCGSSAKTEDTTATTTATTTPTTTATTTEDKEDTSTDAAANTDKKLLGVSVPKASTGWTAAVQYYAEQYVMGKDIEITVVAAENTNEQANQIEELINMKCDAIVLLPINDELATAAQKIMDAGITLINYDRTLGTTEPDYYVAGDNKGVGVQGAKYLQLKLGDDYTVVVVGISGWGAISEERIQGYKETIAEITPNVKILGEYSAENASQEAGLALMTDILSANPEVDAVFSADDELGIGLTQAIKEANRTDIKAVIGGGGCKGYLNKMTSDDYKDIWLGSATYSPSMITDAMYVAEKVLTGSSCDKKIIIPCDLVDRENVEQWKSVNNFDEKAPY